MNEYKKKNLEKITVKVSFKNLSFNLPHWSVNHVTNQESLIDKKVAHDTHFIPLIE